MLGTWVLVVYPGDQGWLISRSHIPTGMHHTQTAHPQVVGLGSKGNKTWNNSYLHCRVCSVMHTKKIINDYHNYSGKFEGPNFCSFHG